MTEFAYRPVLTRVVVGVPDPDKTVAFLTDGFDFRVRTENGRIFADTLGDYGPNGQSALEIRKADSLQFLNVVFTLTEDFDADTLVKNLGGTRTETGGVQLVDPTGLRVAIEPAAEFIIDKPEVSAYRPRRLGHVNARTPDPVLSSEFYRHAFGMALSEQIGDDFFFLRTNTEHHNVGLRRAPRTDLHHLGFELAGWHAYQPILDHLDAAGYKAEYGPGKHRPGTSYFTYVRDPSSGLRFELFADMAHIRTGWETEPIRWQGGDRMTKTINIWGPTPPESFLE
ncbi:VOC family protein [Cryobacterium sp. Y50]|uniref:VOC family protein n=1 Tax=Cryobacterium sp. Y50 TaxID=2048286 RepID=UPI001304F473|nr:VOC family protein [Cryobacterium sp. Y50]